MKLRVQSLIMRHLLLSCHCRLGLSPVCLRRIVITRILPEQLILSASLGSCHDVPGLNHVEISSQLHGLNVVSCLGCGWLADTTVVPGLACLLGFATGTTLGGEALLVGFLIVPDVNGTEFL
ncbi:hypothetical protein B0J14DRAFT_605323 [Halenospora varia]|nr:hypothetical protein B0J14DRAFT_605323 [Halenospora varia]